MKRAIIWCSIDGERERELCMCVVVQIVSSGICHKQLPRRTATPAVKIHMNSGGDLDNKYATFTLYTGHKEM